MKYNLLPAMLLAGSLAAYASAAAHDTPVTALPVSGHASGTMLQSPAAMAANPATVTTFRAAGSANLMKAPSEEGETPSAIPTTMAEPPADAPISTMTKSGIGYTVNTMNGAVVNQPNNGSVTELAEDGDKVYLRPIWSIWPCTGWLVGTKEGNKVTIEFPQLLNISTSDGTYQYAMLAELGEVTENGQTFKTYLASENRTFTYTIGDDGMWTADTKDVLIGAFAYSVAEEESPEAEADDTAQEYPEWIWFGGGDIVNTLQPFDSTLTTPPAEADVQDWLIMINGLGFPGKVAFHDDKCYLAGLSAPATTQLASSYIVGNVADGTVTFPSGQYYGILPDINFTIYFQGGYIENTYFPDYGQYADEFVQEDAIVFNYDEEARTLTTDGAILFGPNKSYDGFYLYMADKPEVRYVAPDTKAERLITPGFVGYSPAEGAFPAMVGFSFSNVSQEGAFLDMSKLYFQMAVDGDLYEFDPIDYTCIKEPTFELPIGVSDYLTVICDGNTQIISIFVAGYDSLEVRLVYTALGEPIYSDWATLLGTPVMNGVGTLSSGSTPESSCYFDMQGRRVSNPASGLYIRADRMSDGTTVFTKTMVR